MAEAKSRIGWDDYFMEMALLARKRSSCRRRGVGAVLVKNKKVLATGYNGAPRGIKDCLEKGECLRDTLKVPSGERHELCRGAHAEENSIAQAAQFGVAIDGATMYCTNFPCSMCVKLLINAGIKEIVYSDGYPDELAKEIISESDVKIRQLKP
jgi:dCMP deaminase